MKKYILFQYETYYPCGGLSDIVDSFATIKEAQGKVEESLQDYNEIVDRDTWKIIFEKDYTTKGWKKL